VCGCRSPLSSSTVSRGRDLLSLTLTFDHAIVDGAPAARFVRRLTDLVESADGLPDVASVSAPPVTVGSIGLRPAVHDARVPHLGLVQPAGPHHAAPNSARERRMPATKTSRSGKPARSATVVKLSCPA
jgi:2-oxoacid dehydrogenase/acyltransferase catalytic subunit